MIGQASGNGFDANGTIALTGRFSSLAGTALVVTASDEAAFIFTVETTAVPEPSTLSVTGIGSPFLAGHGIWTRRRRRACATA